MFMSVALCTLMTRHLHCEYLYLLTFYGFGKDYLKTNQLTYCEGVKDIWTGRKIQTVWKRQKCYIKLTIQTYFCNQWCCEEIFHIPTLTIGNQFYPILPGSCAIQMGLLSIYQRKQDVFGWICINGNPNSFLRRWGGCLAVPQRRWGPLGPHNTTDLNSILLF